MVVLDRFLIFSCDSICLNEDLQFHVLWVCYANQLTGFYMRATLALNWLNISADDSTRVFTL